MPRRRQVDLASLHLPGFDPAATPLIGLGIGLSGLLLKLQPRLAPLPLALGAAAALLFRNPARTPNASGDTIIAPADGTICRIDEQYEYRFLHTDAVRISILTELLDVPIQRSPATGIVAYLEATSGSPARNLQLHTAEPRQSHCLYVGIATHWGPILLLVSGGPFTHRIDCDVAIGTRLNTADRISPARFGARPDLFLPLDMIDNLPAESEQIRAGETALFHVLSH